MPPVNSIKMLAMFRFLFLWMALAVPRASAGFSSIYVFGDGVSNTNNVPTSGGATNYHGDRFCNGRVFVEVLSDWQGVTFDDTKNKSNFGNDSSVLLTNVNNLDLSAFTQQQVANFLFIVWANNADFVDFAGVIDTPYGDEVPWDASISQSLSNHVAAVTTLYNKGARKIVMPNAVDIMRTPFYNDFDEDDRLFVRQQIDGIDGIGGYNRQFKAAMTGAMIGKPGLQIFLPDTFAFFEQVLGNPESFGMVNPAPLNVGGLDAGNLTLQGPGAQYVFWDEFHPTAKFQMHLAAFIQQIISPVKVNSISLSGGNVHLQLENIPLGRAGVVLGSPNLQAPWSEDAVIGTTNPVVFPASGAKRFYRAAFPVVWTWP
jgi:phospholipase/lecithinase/hemolysin